MQTKGIYAFQLATGSFNLKLDGETMPIQFEAHSLDNKIRPDF